MEKIERKKHAIDATGKPLGRIATEIAHLLQGKHKPAYVPNVDWGDSVEVTNIQDVKFTGNKLDQKAYYRHSGYPGGLKKIPVRRVFEANPAEVLHRAVKQMLPKNRLLDARMKRLIIK